MPPVLRTSAGRVPYACRVFVASGAQAAPGSANIALSAHLWLSHGTWCCLGADPVARGAAARWLLRMPPGTWVVVVPPVPTHVLAVVPAAPLERPYTDNE